MGAEVGTEAGVGVREQAAPRPPPPTPLPPTPPPPPAANPHPHHTCYRRRTITPPLTLSRSTGKAEFLYCRLVSRTLGGTPQRHVRLQPAAARMVSGGLRGWALACWMAGAGAVARAKMVVMMIR